MAKDLIQQTIKQGGHLKKGKKKVNAPSENPLVVKRDLLEKTLSQWKKKKLV